MDIPGTAPPSRPVNSARSRAFPWRLKPSSSPTCDFMTEMAWSSDQVFRVVCSCSDFNPQIKHLEVCARSRAGRGTTPVMPRTSYLFAFLVVCHRRQVHGDRGLPEGVAGRCCRARAAPAVVGWLFCHRCLPAGVSAGWLGGPVVDSGFLIRWLGRAGSEALLHGADLQLGWATGDSRVSSALTSIHASDGNGSKTALREVVVVSK